MRSFLMNMKPRSFEDVVAAISLYRPGPMDSIPRFIAGKEDPSTIKYVTPQLEHVLNVTYGCMVYQEQVMQIVRDLAGYSYGRSDLVRRAMAKKKHDVMAKEKEYFINGKLNDDGSIDVPGAVRNGVSKEAAEAIFDEMTAFASYAFNKSHAAAYAVVSMQTAWLKRHYPAEFMAAMLNSIAGNAGKVAYYIAFCRKNGISVLPPDVNRSREKFSVDVVDGKKAIRFGLNAVKNVGKNAIEFIISEREGYGEYKTLDDFTGRVAGGTVNKKAVESLVKAGAMDTLPGNRAQKICVFESFMDAASKKMNGVVAGQLSLFDDPETAPEVTVQLPPMEDLPLRTKLDMEKEFTGIYLSGHPLDEYVNGLGKLSFNTAFLADESGDDEEDAGDSLRDLDGNRVDMGGIITEKQTRATKAGQLMGILTLEDLYGSIEVMVFPKVFERIGSAINSGDTVIISGRLSVREKEAPKLVAQEVRPLKPDKETASAAPAPVTDVKPEVHKLFLRLSRTMYDAVSFILETTPGDIRVNLFFTEENKNYLAPRAQWVSPDFDRAALEDLLGKENVVLK